MKRKIHRKKKKFIPTIHNSLYQKILLALRVTWVGSTTNGTWWGPYSDSSLNSPTSSTTERTTLCNSRPSCRRGTLACSGRRGYWGCGPWNTRRVCGCSSQLKSLFNFDKEYSLGDGRPSNRLVTPNKGPYRSSPAKAPVCALFSGVKSRRQSGAYGWGSGADGTSSRANFSKGTTSESRCTGASPRVNAILLLWKVYC